MDIRVDTQRIQRVLIVGTGSIGERHLRCFQLTGRVQAGFVEIRPDLMEVMTRKYPEATGHSSLDAALAEHWDAAVIATPAPLHVSQALEFVQRRIPLLIEKPLSVEMTGVAELIAAAEASASPVGVAYVYRAHPVVAEMRAALQSGKFGRPVQIVATCGQHFPTYRPAYAEIYYARRESGGGAVQDALTHIINLGEWLVGPVDRVVADLDHLVMPRVEVEDTVHVLTRHGRVMGNYSLNQHQAPNELTVTVICEQGTARFENHFCRWRFQTQPETAWVDSTPMTLERDTLFIRQAQAFLDAASGRIAPLCSLQEGLSTLRANRAILRSADASAWCSTGEEGPLS